MCISYEVAAIYLIKGRNLIKLCAFLAKQALRAFEAMVKWD
jgi:hypothetical protein